MSKITKYLFSNGGRADIPIQHQTRTSHSAQHTYLFSLFKTQLHVSASSKKCQSKVKYRATAICRLEVQTQNPQNTSINSWKS
jgi:hypothetical protein